MFLEVLTRCLVKWEWSGLSKCVYASCSHRAWRIPPWIFDAVFSRAPPPSPLLLHSCRDEKFVGGVLSRPHSLPCPAALLDLSWALGVRKRGDVTVTPQAGRIKAPVSVNNIKCAKALASRRRTVQCTEQACMGGQTCRNVSVGGAEGNVGVPSFVRPLPAFLSQEQLDGTESCFIMLLHLLSETETSCLYRRWCRTFSLTLHISHSAPCSLHGDAHVLTNLGKMFDGKVSPCN